MNKTEFINAVKEGAILGKQKYGILASLTISQAILESGWGNSELAQKANNLFGIKAFSDWAGIWISLPTVEWYNGRKQVMYSDFRAYNSLNESIEDHNKLLSNQRYRQVRESADYKQACRRVYECGYATDPVYAEKLINIIEENKLYEFDNITDFQEAAVTITNEKIRKFQHLCNVLNIKDSEGNWLDEDNILGWRTKSCIERMPLLKLGSSGPAVEFIQEIAGALPIDGDFGPITRQCVIQYQRDKHIVDDGIVGTQTWTTVVTT